MATVNIEQRTTKKGIKFRARVRIRDPLLEKGYYEESNTFTTRAKASHWATNRAKFLEVEGIPTKGIKGSDLREATLSNLIEMYLQYWKLSENELQRSKIFALSAIAKRDISSNLVSQITKDDVIDYAKMRRREGVSGYTTYQDLIYMKSVLRAARDKEFMVNGNADCVIEAVDQIKTEITIQKIPKGERILEFSANEKSDIEPSEREMKLLRSALLVREQHPSAKIPYLQILDFAIATCMRVSEICRVKWENFDEDAHTIVIEDRKHPTNKIGNNVTIPLISGAYEIVLNRRDKKIKELKEKGLPFNQSEEIFPFESRSVTAGWQRCRKQLINEGHSIKQIRFHDLRAYGATLLIKKGWSLPKVSKVTGHRDMKVLNNIYNRYEVSVIAKEDFIERLQIDKKSN